ncbi:MAG: sigma factor [Solirubrobacteraceae bacterium]
MTSDRIGHFDPELFTRFRGSRGIRRRALLNQLVLENAPLVKLLVDQLRGGPDTRKRPGARAMGGCQGFRELEWEDAFQAGLVGLARALEGLDLSKGKLAGYAKLWIRHELQRLVYNGGALVRVPRGAGDQVPVALSGDQQEIDRLSGGMEDGLAATDEVTPEDLERWQETGEWPESLEQLRASRLPPPPPPVVYSTGLEAFLTNRVALARHGRVETWVAHNAYRIECRRAARPELLRGAFVAEMGRLANVREVWIRTPTLPSARGLAGMRLVSCAGNAA